MSEISFPLFDVVFGLRTNEEVLITAKISKISDEDEHETLAFLRNEFDKERINYPFSAPSFNPNAALWASKVIYFSAQLLLNRTDTAKKLDELFPDYSEQLDASAFLSADLCLRFLSNFIREFKNLDVEDPIVPILVAFAEKFHYSVIGFELDYDKLNFEEVMKNDSLKQLYLDRIVERKAMALSKQERIESLLMENFGDYKHTFWKEL